jgi:eukaryotic-like serine/threonine-protein kinase
MVRARGRVGTVVKDKWRLEALLGAGGMACVYSAVHRNGRRVAIKVLHAELCAVPSIVTRFLREGYLANRVGHPGAVVVLDDDRMDDGSVFLVMELLEGHSLERYAKPGRPTLPRDTTTRLMAETLDVLAAAHARGIVHRDIKPANLFLTTDGHVKVLDFGIARLAEATGDGQLTQTGASIGTPSFMPPEQARGRWEQVDARTDVWAVGATMYALLKGDRPRHAETKQEEMLLAMTQPLVPLATVVPDIAPAIAAVVDRAVSHEREGRWGDAAAMREAVGKLLGGPTHAEGAAPGPVPAAAPGEAPAGGGTLALPEYALTTGRPLASQPSATPAGPSRAAQLVVAVIAAFVTLAVLGAVGLVAMRGPHAVASKPATAHPPEAASVLPAPLPAAIAPAASATSTALEAPSIVPALSAPTASAAPSASVASPPAHPVPHPAAAPRGPAANPFDQRF